MQDVQNSPAQVALPINRVGINNFKLPLLVSDRVNSFQHSVAQVDMGVDLPAHFKGTHMSRFVELLENWNDKLEYASVKDLLSKMLLKLEARKAFAKFQFTYFIRKESPASTRSCLQGYECCITGEMTAQESSDKSHLDLTLEIEVPVMTVCPCSKAISDEGAHSQRAMIRMKLKQTGFAWIEEFVELAEQSASSPVYPLLKREDEKVVTETSFANPCFVEDVVRNLAQKLCKHEFVDWFRVEVESMESIHAHNAFACIEQGKWDK